MFLNKSFKADKINSQLNENGYVIINNIFDHKIINKIEELTKSKIKKLNKKFSLNERYLQNTIIEEIVNSDEVKNLFLLINKKNSRNNNSYNYHFLLNHTPEGQNKNSKLSFHFDAYQLTMIIPINTRKNDNNAYAMSLDIIPNIRKSTNSMIVNLLYKCLFQNKIFRKFSNTNIFNFFFKYKTLKIKYNQIIIFNGFRSLHSASVTNSATQSEKTRLIIHIYNPFENNKINKLIFNNIQKDRKKKLKVVAEEGFEPPTSRI